MKNKNQPENLAPKQDSIQQDSFIGKKEDIVQHTIKGTPRFLRGLIENEYESPFMFLFAYFQALLYLFISLLGLIILTSLVFYLIDLKELSLIPILILPFLLSIVLPSMFGVKILKRLIVVYKTKDKKYKLKTFWILALMTFMFIFILIRFIPVIFSVVNSN